jgi:enoyl-CoA hydratase
VLVWPALMGALRAKSYLFTGQRIDAATAVEVGLATRIAPAGTALHEALAAARSLAELPRQALADTKRALNSHLRRAVEPVIDFAFAAESETFATLGSGNDAQAGHR